METLNHIFSGIIGAAMFISSLVAFPFTGPERVATLENQVQNQSTQVQNLGAFSPAAGGTYRLQTSIGSSDTTIRLASFKEPVSNLNITMTSLASDIGYATLDPQSTTRKEFVSFSGITQNTDGTATLTGVTRGLSFLSPHTASSTLRQAHPGQTIFILSDSPQLFNEYAKKRSDETITGQWTFSVFPITPASPTASETTAGIVELATGAEAAASTNSGTVGRLALPATLATSTRNSATAANVVPVTNGSGVLAAGWLSASSAVGSSTSLVNDGSGNLSWGFSSQRLTASSTPNLNGAQTASTTIVSATIPANMLTGSNAVRVSVPIIMQTSQSQQFFAEAGYGTATTTFGVTSNFSLQSSMRGTLTFTVVASGVSTQYQTLQLNIASTTKTAAGYFDLGSTGNTWTVQATSTSATNAAIAQPLNIVLKTTAAGNSWYTFAPAIVELLSNE